MFIHTSQSPEERSVQQVHESSLLGTIAKTALTMVGYGIGMKVFRGLSFRANIGLGKFVTKLVQPRSPLSKAFTASLKDIKLSLNKNSAKTMAAFGRFEKFVNRGRTEFRTALKRLDKTPLQRAMNPLVKEGRYSPQLVHNVAERTRGQLQRAGLADGSYLTRSQQLRDIRITSIMQNTNTFRNSTTGKRVMQWQQAGRYARANSQISMFKAVLGQTPNVDLNRLITGKMHNYATYLGSMAAFDYALYNATSSGDKPWYSPKKVAEWAAFTVGTDMAMHGAMGRAKVAGSFAKRFINKAMTTNDTGKKIAHFFLGQGQRVGQSATFRAYTDSIDAMSKYSKENNPVKQAGSTWSNWQNEFFTLKNRYLKKASDPKDAFDATLENLERHIDPAKDRGHSGILKGRILENWVSKNQRNNPNKWAQTINNWLTTDIQSQTKLADNTDVFRGSGWVSLDGKDYNIANVMPNKLAAQTFNFMYDHFHILGFKPLSLLGMKPMIDSATDHFTLYTAANQPALVDIGVGYDPIATKQRAGDLLTEKRKQAYEIASEGINDEPLLQRIHDQLDNISQGKLGNYGNTVKEREAMTQFAKDYKAITGTGQMIDRMAELRGRLSPKEQAEHMALLKQGYAKVMDNESMLFIGNKAYYSVKSGGNKWQSFQMGYDINKGTYHQFQHISQRYAGTMAKIVAQQRGFTDEYSIEPTFVARHGMGGANLARNRSRVNPNAGAVDKLSSGISDWFEITNKPDKSIFDHIPGFFRKFFDPRTLRNQANLTATGNVDRYTRSIMRSKTSKTMIKTLQSRLREADTVMTNKLVDQADFIDAIISYGAAHPRAQNVAEATNPIWNGFITGDIPTAEFPHTFRKKAQATIDALSELKSRYGETYGLQNVTRDDISFIQGLMTSDNPLKLLDQSYRGKVTNRAAYNNLVFRTYFNGIDNAQKTELIEHLQHLPSLATYKKDIDMLGLSGIVDTYSNVNIRHLDDSLSDLLATNTIKEMNANPVALDSIVRHSEPLWQPTSLHDNMMYPNPGYTCANVTLSKNLDPEGKMIYTFGEQLLGSAKNSLGKTYKTVTTETSMRTMQMTNAINNTMNIVGVGFNQHTTPTIGSFAKKVVFKRVLPAMALGAAYRVSDTFLDENPTFDGTVLGEGISPLAANIVGQARLAMAGINDTLGITSMAKYLEDVMPGSAKSPLSSGIRGFGSPFAGLALGYKMMGPRGGIVGGSIGAAIGILTAGGPLGAIGKYDVSKSRAELIEEYSGRRNVEVYKGAGWLLGAGAVGGQKIERYGKSWYHEAMSQPHYTNALYGGKVERLFAPLDMNHYAEKHQVTRPYPVGEMALSNLPLFGNTLAMGGGIQNQEEMKLAAYASATTGGDLNMAAFDLHNVSQGLSDRIGAPGGANLMPSLYGSYSQETGIGETTMGRPAMLPTAPRARMQSAFTAMTDFAGLRGFVSETAFTQFNNGLMPFEDTPIFESASAMTSPFRHYWDAGMGDMLGLNEGIRRFIPKTEGQHVNEWNNLPNNMPTWLAGAEGLVDFGAGDAFCVKPDSLIETQSARLVRADSMFSQVVSHAGYIRKITGKIVRPRQENEKAYTISATSLSCLPLTVSEDHPFLSISLKTVESLRYVQNMKSHGHNQYKATTTYDQIYPTWISAKDLTPDHYVLYPIHKDIPYKEPVIDLSKTFNGPQCVIGNWMYYGVSAKMAHDWELLYSLDNKTCIRGELQTYLYERGINRRTYERCQRAFNMGYSPYRINKILHINRDIAFTMGLWLAEGSAKSECIDVACNVSELEYFNRTIEQANIHTTISLSRNGETNSDSIGFSAQLPIQQMFASHMGYDSYNKILSDELYSILYTNPDLCSEFIRAYIIGDGSIFKKHNISRITITSVATPLLYQIRSLLLHNEIPSSIIKGDNNAYYLSINADINCLNSADFLMNAKVSTDGTQGSFFIWDNYLVMKIKDIQEEYMTREFIGIEVPIDNSFCVNGIATHNTKVKKGEMRLPGAGFEALNNVRFRFPLEAEYLGRPFQEQVAQLTGNHIPTIDEKYDKLMRGKIAKQMAEQLSLSNAAVALDRTPFDAHSNMSGKLDIVADGTGINIHAVSAETFAAIGTEGLPHHVAEINASLILSGQRYGNLMYYNVENGDTKSINVVANIKQYYNEMNQLMTAKSVAQEALDQYGPSVGINMASAYSRLDRMKILGDVAPYSQAYQDTLNQVRKQAATGLLTEVEELEFKKIQEERSKVADRFMFTDYKFNRGAPTTEEEQQYQDYINSSYNIFERTMGSIYEGFAHMNTPIHNKLLNVASPLEQYERMEILGKPIRDWKTPYSSFIRPYMTTLASRESPFSGALSFGTGGLIFGGPIGGVVGGAFGAAYGTLNPGLGTIPGYRKQERELNAEIDRIRYEKARQVYETTGSIDAQKEMEHTMTYQYDNATNAYQLYGSMPRHERGYMRQFAETGTAEERDRIMEMVPTYAQPALMKAWYGNDYDIPDTERALGLQNEMPNQNWAGWLSDVPTDDIAVKMYNRASIDAKENSLGWQDQIRKMRTRPAAPSTFTQSMQPQQAIYQQVQSVLQSIVAGAQVTAVPTSTPGITVTVV